MVDMCSGMVGFGTGTITTCMLNLALNRKLCKSKRLARIFTRVRNREGKISMSMRGECMKAIPCTEEITIFNLFDTRAVKF